MKDITIEEARIMYGLSDYVIGFEPYTINGESIYFYLDGCAYKVYNNKVEQAEMSKDQFILFVQSCMNRVNFRVIKNTLE